MDLASLQLTEAEQRIETLEILLNSEKSKSKKLHELLATTNNIRSALTEENEQLKEKNTSLELLVMDQGRELQRGQFAVDHPSPARGKSSASTVASPPRLSRNGMDHPDSTEKSAAGDTLTSLVDRIKHENATLFADNDTLKVQNGELRRALEEATSQRQQHRDPASAHTGELPSPQALVQLKKEVGKLQRQLRTCETALMEAQEERDSLQRQLSDCRVELLAARHPAMLPPPRDLKNINGPPPQTAPSPTTMTPQPTPRQRSPHRSTSAAASAAAADEGTRTGRPHGVSPRRDAPEVKPLNLPPWKSSLERRRSSARSVSPWAKSPRENGRTPGMISYKRTPSAQASGTATPRGEGNRSPRGGNHEPAAQIEIAKKGAPAAQDRSSSNTTGFRGQRIVVSSKTRPATTTNSNVNSQTHTPNVSPKKRISSSSPSVRPQVVNAQVHQGNQKRGIGAGAPSRSASTADPATESAATTEPATAAKTEQRKAFMSLIADDDSDSFAPPTLQPRRFTAKPSQATDSQPDA